MYLGDMFNRQRLTHQVFAQRCVPVVHNDQEGSFYQRIVDLSFIREARWFTVAVDDKDRTVRLMKYTDEIPGIAAGVWEPLLDCYNDDGWKLVTRLVSKKDTHGQVIRELDGCTSIKPPKTREYIRDYWQGYTVTELNNRENAPELQVHDGVISAVRSVATKTFVGRMLEGSRPYHYHEGIGWMGKRDLASHAARRGRTGFNQPAV
ncbi:MAG: hypothetical protein S4CHLAM37_03590 [Chlamydiia bacterium]|nr:hypothetical protein [Chlamydiia bacterium]